MEFTFDKEKHRFIVDDIIVPSITQVLVSAGMIDTRFFDDYGRTRGTYVHKIVELDINHSLDINTVDDALKGYYKAWKRFRKEKEIEIIECEKPRVSDSYPVFGGIPDIVCGIKNVKSVIDIKTGGENPATRIQTAAQAILTGSIMRYSLQLKDNGKYKLIPYPVIENGIDRRLFNSALSLWWWKRNNNLIKLEE